MLALTGGIKKQPIPANWYSDTSVFQRTTGLNGVVTQADLGGGVKAALINAAGNLTLTPDIDISTGDYTVETFIRFTTVTAGYQSIIARCNPAGDNKASFLLFLEATNRLNFLYTANGTSWSGNINASSYILAVNTWYHFAITRNVNTITMWVNGVSQGTPITVGAIYNTSQAWTFGSYPGNAAVLPLRGYLAGTRITLGAALYTGTFTPPTALPATTGQPTSTTGTHLILNYGGTAAPTV
jgi:hypothetical protein